MVMWILIDVIIIVAAFIILLIAFVIIFSALYFPYPHDICDRWKLVCMDALLRLSNEFLVSIFSLFF